MLVMLLQMVQVKLLIVVHLQLPHVAQHGNILTGVCLHCHLGGQA
jgi:hypothetical protein